MSPGTRQLGRHAAIYGVGILISRAVGFIMLPIYTRFLTPADYGVLELLQMTIDVIGTLAGLGLAGAIFKFYSAADSEHHKGEVVSTAAIGQIVLAAVTAVAGFIYAPRLTMLVLGADYDPLLFRLFFVIYLLQSAAIVPRHLLRALNKSVMFVVVSTMQLLVALSGNIYFVVYQGLGIKGVLLGTLISKAAVTSFLTVFLVRRVGVSFSGARLRQLAAFGYPLVFWALGNFVLTFSDRYFLKFFSGAESVGLYALAYRFGFILGALVIVPFSQVWQPQRFEVAKRADASSLFGRVFLYFNVFLAGTALAIVLLVEDFLRVIADPAFWSAHTVVPLIIAAQVFVACARFVDIGLYLKNRTDLLGWSSGLAVVTVLLLHVILVPRFGVFGAAWASLLVFAGTFVLVYRFSQRLYPIAYPWGRIGRLYAIVVAMYLLRQAISVEAVALSLTMSVVVGLVTLVLISFMVLTEAERASWRAIVRARLRRSSLRP